MSYALHYFYTFKNQQQNIIRVEILQDGFAGTPIELIGTGNPFSLEWLSGDGDIYSPIKGSVGTIEFLSRSLNGTSLQLSDFYSDADNAFRVDVYGDDTISLIWTGFVQIDNSAEDFQDINHPITLEANDNLGLLQTIKFDTAFANTMGALKYTQASANVDTVASPGPPFLSTFQSNNVPSDPGAVAGDFLFFQGTYYHILAGSYNAGLTLLTLSIQELLPTASYTGVPFAIYGHLGITSFGNLTQFFSAFLQQTGLQLDTFAYLNIFENSTDDRSMLDTNDFLQQTVIPVNYVVDNDGLFKDCYTILNDLCRNFGMTVLQAQGAWQIFREGELRLYGGVNIPGTQYDYQFTIVDPVVSSPKLAIGRGLPLHFVNANQQKRILRPLEYAKRTLTYEFPQWIDNQTFVYAIILNSTFTYNSIVYNLYQEPATWSDPDSIGSIVVAYDSTLGNTEIRRFMNVAQITPQGSKHWLQFNPIPVVAGSRFSFSLDFFAFLTNYMVIPPPTHGVFYFRARFQFLDASGNIYFLAVTTSGGFNFLFWDGPFASSTWDSDNGLEVTSDENYGNTISYSVSSFDSQGVIPVFPGDGLFLIGLCGNNGHVVNYDTGVLNINLNIENNLGAITSMNAQVHKQSQAIAAKNNSEIDIQYDDTIVNTIKGTLLTDAVTSYGIWVGDFYSTKTYTWHHGTTVEALKLGQIITYDTLFIQRIARMILEGDVKNIVYRESGGVSGNGNIGIDPPIIEITGRPDASGIEVGMILEFEGEAYKILGVAYVGGIVQITTDPAPHGPDYIGVDYTIHWPDKYVSPLNLFTVDALPDKNFIPGIMKVDFRNCLFSITMYEVYTDTEVDADLSNAYTFNYLFRT
jgi:hypothetical protein